MQHDLQEAPVGLVCRPVRCRCISIKHKCPCPKGLAAGRFPNSYPCRSLSRETADFCVLFCLGFFWFFSSTGRGGRQGPSCCAHSHACTCIKCVQLLPGAIGGPTLRPAHEIQFDGPKGQVLKLSNPDTIVIEPSPFVCSATPPPPMLGMPSSIRCCCC